MAVIALITWWSCNAFLPVFATGLAQTEAALRGLDKSATLHLVEDWKFTATMVFNIGGLLGTLRSEEHTSELQSLMRISYAVFCLKKTTAYLTIIAITCCLYC